MALLVHQHLIVRAKVKRPLASPACAMNWLRRVIAVAGMKIALGPYAWRCDEPGNAGVTAMAIITTSHCALHEWDTEIPALLQFDLYSCAPFRVSEILGAFAPLEPVSLTHRFLDREDF